MYSTLEGQNIVPKDIYEHGSEFKFSWWQFGRTRRTDFRPNCFSILSRNPTNGSSFSAIASFDGGAQNLSGSIGPSEYTGFGEKVLTNASIAAGSIAEDELPRMIPSELARSLCRITMVGRGLRMNGNPPATPDDDRSDGGIQGVLSELINKPKIMH